MSRISIRFFAQAADAARAKQLEFDADTVSDAIAQAIAACGPGLAEVVAISRIWVNAVAASGDTILRDGDEVAVLPPVSGG
ncbi:MAG: MoaD/ThiS family protein [Acidimicrobiia bacterium]